MSIFSRIFKVGQAAANKAIDSLEKPELMLEQAIRDKEEQIRLAKKAVQECIATERKSKAILNKEIADQATWEHKAEIALKAGNEELATKALLRASEHETKAAAFQPQWEEQRNSVDALKVDLHKMDDQLADYKRNKTFIIAQSKAADVKKDIYEAKAKISKSSNNADDLMARLKAKAEKSSLEADAAKEMADEFEGGDSLEKEFEDLDGTQAGSAVAEKLAAMKAKMGK